MIEASFISLLLKLSALLAQLKLDYIFTRITSLEYPLKVFSKCIRVARADVLCFVSFWAPLVLHLLMLIVCFRLALRAAFTGIINKYSSRQAAQTTLPIRDIYGNLIEKYRTYFSPLSQFFLAVA